MKYILTALTIVLVLGIGAIVMRQPAVASASVYNATNIQVATTTGRVAVTTSTRLLATTTSVLGPSYTRVYATICNANANPVYLALDADQPASLANSTYVIAAAAGYSACYEITDRNQYQGSITASSTNETSTAVTFSDYVQQ